MKMPWEYTSNAEIKAENRPTYLTGKDVVKYFGAVRWLWPSVVPRGHVSLLVGPQAVGKSFLLAHLMAVIAGNLEAWPDGEPYTEGPGDVIFIETEGMAGETCRRLEAAGGNLARVKLLGDDPLYVPSLLDDLPAIEELAIYTGAKLIAVDSLSGGYMGDENSAGDMRQVLQQLAAMASRLGIGVSAVHHLRKKSQFESDKPNLDRVRGSTSITQFCRSVLGLWKPDDAKTVRVEVIKSNFCRPPEPFGFEIDDKGRLIFRDAPEEEKAATVHERACEFLQVELQDGPRAAADILRNAELAGFSRKSLYRAKDVMNVISVRKRGGWEWALPHI